VSTSGLDAKRAFDLALALPLLAAGALPMLAIALLLRVVDGKPVLFRQTRPGRDGRPFTLLKFRTMRHGAEPDELRLTALGRLLRAASLDELPQLWNVVRGDMSLIGPRPTLRYQVEKYTARQRKRLDVKPGITGWAQVHGRASLPWDERIELDVWYVENRSPWLDLKIIAKTPRALFGGTYKGQTGGWGTKSALNSPRPDSNGSSRLPTRKPE